MSRTLQSRARSIAPWWRRFKRNGYRPDRCEHCGHGFRWSRDSRHASGNRDGKNYHGPCIAYLIWRRRAEDRLAVLGVVRELTSITSRDVENVVELRAQELPVWSVFYDLDRSRV